MIKYTFILIIALLGMIISKTSAINLDFDANLFLGSNSGMQNNYQNLHFQYGNNTLGGVIFWKGLQTIAPTNIIFGSQTVSNCSKRVQGAYYNPARGNRLRPLDPDTLAQRVLTENTLNLPQTYSQLALSGGLYTNCQGNPNAVYGYIMHTWNNSTQFHLIAGATINLGNNSYTTIADSSLQINQTTLNANGFIFDPLGGIAAIIATSTTNQNTGAFNARLQFPSLYTNTPFVNGLVYVTEPAGYIIQGDTQGTFAGTLANTEFKDIILSNTQGVKTLNTTFTSLVSAIVLTGTVQITLDLTAPTLTITSPTSGSTISGTLQASWTAQDNIGIQSTLIQVYQGNNLVYSNTSTSNSQNITTLTNGSYIISITVYDLAGNSTTQSLPFTVTNSPVSSNRSITGFTHITGANLNTIYTSNSIIIAGLATGNTVSGSINTGILIKNGLDIGTGGVFGNGDTVVIALRSANSYNSTHTATLSINNSTLPFSITTKLSANDPGALSGGFCLSTNQYALIFLAMKNAYGDNETRFREALILMRSMIRDIITITANQGGGPTIYALQCFADIIDNYLMSANSLPPNQNNPNERIYIAPNGKQYRVEYIPNLQGYSSPDFQYRKIFVNYETFTRHIDINNPRTTSRDHIVDPSFTPVVHTAPNGKRYTIQKTNRGFMSYQFIIAAYFETLEKTRAHINRHNPR